MVRRAGWAWLGLSVRVLRAAVLSIHGVTERRRRRGERVWGKSKNPFVEATKVSLLSFLQGSLNSAMYVISTV